MLGQEDVGKPQPSKQPNRLIQFYVHSHQSCTAESSSVLCTDILYCNGTVLYCKGTVLYCYGTALYCNGAVLYCNGAVLYLY